MASQDTDVHLWFDPVYVVLQNVLKMCIGKGADDDIRHGVEFAIKLCKDRLDYCEKVSTEASSALNTIANETMAYPFDKAFKEGKTKLELGSIMMSGCLEGKFLQSVVMMHRAKRVLEVGMFTGYAALACAEVLPEDGEVVTCELDPFLKDLARSFFNNSSHGKKIDIRVGPASDTLHDLALENRQFEVIFVDANKDGYLEYYMTIMSKNLLADHGVILFDNCLFHGLPYCSDDDGPNTNSGMNISETLGVPDRRSGEAIKELNDFIATQDDVFRVLLPIRDGVLLVQRKLKY